MKKIKFAIQQWWKTVSDEYHQKQVLRREKDVKAEAEHRLQVREYEGDLYLCFDNVPILQAIDVVEDLKDVVRVSREYFVDYTLVKRFGNVGS